MGFFGIPISDPKNSKSGFFYFGLCRKIPKCRGSGLRFENSVKIPCQKYRKARDPGDRDLDLKIPNKFRENLGKSRKSRGSVIFSWDGISDYNRQ